MIRPTVLVAAVAALALLVTPAVASFVTQPLATNHAVSTAADFPSEEDPEEPDDPDAPGQVWICKLVGTPGGGQEGGPGNLRYAANNNPRQVGAGAVEDGVFSDQHGSPVVTEDTDCATLPLPGSEQTTDGQTVDEQPVNEQPVNEQPSDEQVLDDQVTDEQVADERIPDDGDDVDTE